VPPSRVERPQQQGAGARRGHKRQRAIDDALVDPRPGAWRQVQHRRLSEAADELVRSRQNEVGTHGESVLRQGRVEGEVGAPRLVDDQRRPPTVRHRREGPDVRNRAVVGRRHDDHAHGVRRVCEREVERLRRQAVGYGEVRVQLGRGPLGPQAREDQPVDGAGVHVALHDHFLTHARQRQADRVVALGCAVGEEPGLFSSPGVRGKLQCARQRWDRRPDIDPVDHKGDVQGEGALAQSLPKHRVGAATALMTRDVVATRLLRRVAAQRL
jgi:hypothetical protein